MSTGSARQIEAGRALIVVGIDRKNFNTGLVDLTNRLKSIGQVAKQLAVKFAALGAAIGAAFAGLLKVVADVEGATKRFSLIFGQLADEMRSELQELSDRTGIALTTLVQQASTFGAVFADIRAGLDERQFVQVIAKTQQALVDLAGIGNISIPEAAERMKSAFTSTGESVDQFGFNLRKANLQAEATRLGIEQSIMTMSEQQKQLLKLSIFLRTTERTGVRFVDMVDTLNGQFTLLRSNLLELVVNFGSLMSKAFVPVLRLLNKLTIAMRPVAKALAPLAVLMGPLAGVLLTMTGALLMLGLAARFIAFALGGFGELGTFLKNVWWFMGSLVVSIKSFVKWLPKVLAMLRGFARLVPIFSRLAGVIGLLITLLAILRKALVTAARFAGGKKFSEEIDSLFRHPFWNGLRILKKYGPNVLRDMQIPGFLPAGTRGFGKAVEGIRQGMHGFFDGLSTSTTNPWFKLLFGELAALTDKRPRGPGEAAAAAAGLPPIIASQMAMGGDIARQLAAPVGGASPEESMAEDIADMRGFFERILGDDHVRVE